MTCFMEPTQPPPSPVRPWLRIFIATLKPLPTSPRTLAAGTRTLSSTTVVVELARRPILSSCGPVVTPAMSRVTMKAVILPSGVSVLAKTVKKSAMPPFVIQIFSPVRIQSSPSRTAWVFTEAASEPAPASVRQNAAMSSPLASLGRYLAFCSSVPMRMRPFMPIELWAPAVRATEPSCRESSWSVRE